VATMKSKRRLITKFFDETPEFYAGLVMTFNNKEVCIWVSTAL
jgi:hypothetical protein